MAILGEKYEFWFQAIKHDDDDTVKCTLMSPISNVEKDRFLNGTFQLREDIPTSTAGIQKRFTRPFILAAVFGSLRVCGVMIQNGVDVYSQEANKNNVLHCLVWAALLNRKQEGDIVSTFKKLCKILPQTDILNLLKGEQENGLRPLELAVQHRMFKLTSAILDVPNMILIKEKIIGISVYRWYDVTEYLLSKSNSRDLVSPLAFLAKINKNDLHSTSVRTILSKGIISEWSHRTVLWKRFSSYFLLVANTVFLTVLCFCRDNITWSDPVNRIVDDVHYSLHSLNSTSTNGHCNDAQLFSYSAASEYFMQSYLLLCLAFLGSFALISLIRLVIRNKRLDSKLSGPGGNALAHRSLSENFVRYMMAFQFFVDVTTEFILINYFLYKPSETILSFINLARLGSDVCVSWTIWTYMRYLPIVGRPQLYLEKIFIKAFMMTCIFILITTFFVRVEMLFFNYNTNQDCVKDFSNAGISFYTMFSTFLNMKDYRTYKVDSKSILYAMHISYVFAVALLLYNITIAMVTGAVESIEENYDIEMKLSQLDTIMEIEYNLSAIPIMNRVFNRWWTFTVGYFFSEFDGRFCIVDIVSGNRDRVKKVKNVKNNRNTPARISNIKLYNI